eukprot:scaffold13234_cov118-Isochrysis_galbana.AAC.1
MHGTQPTVPTTIQRTARTKLKTPDLTPESGVHKPPAEALLALDVFSCHFCDSCATTSAATLATRATRHSLGEHCRGDLDLKSDLDLDGREGRRRGRGSRRGGSSGSGAGAKGSTARHGLHGACMAGCRTRRHQKRETERKGHQTNFWSGRGSCAAHSG